MDDIKNILDELLDKKLINVNLILNNIENNINNIQNNILDINFILYKTDNILTKLKV